MPSLAFPLPPPVPSAGPPQLPHKDKRYLVETGLTIFLFALSFSLHLFMVPKPLPFFLGDLSIAYPLMKETVPILRLFAISFLVPAIAILAGHALQHLRSASSPLKTLVVSYLWCLLGVFQAMAILFTAVNFLKLLTGRQRPNYLALCDLDGYRGAVEAGGKTLQEWWSQHPFGKLGDVSRCRGTVTNVADSLRSFPSGHSAISFASCVYTALYLRNVFGVPAGVSISVPALFSALPLAISSFVAVSRVVDRWHNTDDVAIGSAVGIVAGFLGWQHYLSLRASGHAPTHGSARLEVEARARDRMKAFAGRMLKGKGRPGKVPAPVVPSAVEPSKKEALSPIAAPAAPAVPPSPSEIAVTPLARARAASKLPLFIERMLFRPRTGLQGEPVTPGTAAQLDPLSITPEEESEERELQALLAANGDNDDGASPYSLAPPTPVLSHLAGGRSVTRHVSGEMLAGAPSSGGGAGTAAAASEGLTTPNPPTSLQEAEEVNDRGTVSSAVAKALKQLPAEEAEQKGKQQQQQSDDVRAPSSPISVSSAVATAAPPRRTFAPLVSSPLSGGNKKQEGAAAGGQPQQPSHSQRQ